MLAWADIYAVYRDSIVIIAPEHLEADSHIIEAAVLKVFDGGGFLIRIKAYEMTDDLRDQRELEVPIRCGFIDAPEMDQPGGGPEAKSFSTSLIGDRWLELVILTRQSTGGAFDRHGLIVCLPYLTESYSVGEFRAASSELHHIETFGDAMVVPRNIELEMVLNGWTWVIERYGPDERYFQALEDARRQKRGIWDSENNVNQY